jgi:hypothetical protein
MEPSRVVLVDWDDADTSLIYRCATDGYWRVYDTGRAVRAGPR